MKIRLNIKVVLQMILILILLCVLNAWTIVASSRASHHVTSSLGSQILADYYTTNPVYVVTSQISIFTNGQFRSIQILQTNYLWKRY